MLSVRVCMERMVVYVLHIKLFEFSKIFLISQTALFSTCQTSRSQFNSIFRPNIFYIHNIHYFNDPPLQPAPHIIIQFLEFTYSIDLFLYKKIPEKIEKNMPNFLKIYKIHVGMSLILL